MFFQCAHRPLQLENAVREGFVTPIFLIAAGILEPRELSGKGSPIRSSPASHAPARAEGSPVRRIEGPGWLEEGLGSHAGACRRAPKALALRGACTRRCNVILGVVWGNKTWDLGPN